MFQFVSNPSFSRSITRNLDKSRGFLVNFLDPLHVKRAYHCFVVEKSGFLGRLVTGEVDRVCAPASGIR